MTRFQAHPSEQTVRRIRNDRGWDQRFGKRERRSVCRDCGMTHGRIRYAHPVQPNPDESSLLELGLGVAVLLVWFVGLFWAMPVILTAAMQ
jgi:hypothetical protein